MPSWRILITNYPRQFMSVIYLPPVNYVAFSSSVSSGPAAPSKYEAKKDALSISSEQSENYR